MATTFPQPSSTEQSFRHEALFYDGAREFVQGTVPFVLDGISAGQAVLVVVSAAKIELLRRELGGKADLVRFADMDEVGHNPARIIPAWRDFVSDHDGSGMRGIGEPISSARTPEELVECQRHESLLNLAFDGMPAWWLLCPYDTQTLDAAVLQEARGSHPFLTNSGGHTKSPAYRGIDDFARPFDVSLPDPPAPAEEFPIDPGHLDHLRRFIDGFGAAGLLDAAKRADLVLAVNELATNSLRHGGGSGFVRAWLEDDSVVCEVRDGGRLDDPLAGRERPNAAQERGFGLWLVHQLCDLVQIRTFDSGTVIRIYMTRR